ncbi:MAG: gamma-glutamyltransferase, partial [Proteobacteria bacterium]
VYPELFSALEARRESLSKDPAAAKIFLDSSGHAWPVGHILKQADLAKTLRTIASRGANEFYEGKTGKSISRFVKLKGGLITEKDLRNYKVHFRKPVTGKYAGYDVYSMPPPSSGGVHVLQFLKMLEQDHLAQAGFLSARSIHVAASALQSAFIDRAKYLGDPDFVNVPVAGLIDSAYTTKRRAQFANDRALKADEVKAGIPEGASGAVIKKPEEPSETTHFSMMDAEGNAISSTQTVNGWMGAAIVVPGTGILLNNEMDDFSAKTGTQNMFGAVGGEPNAIQPGKTPLSSMSPTILVKDGISQLVVGAPGGTRIISCVAQTILNVVEFKLPLESAVSTIRYHHQWQPDQLVIDPPGPAPDVLQSLKEMGYKVEIKPVGCKVMAVVRDGSMLRAVSDPRDIGTAWTQ